MALHNSLVSDDMHTLIRWAHTNAAQRAAETVTANDVGKLSRQADNGSLWLLNGVAPALWQNISGLGVTFTQPLNMWPKTTNLNEWYGPDFWQNLNSGAFNLSKSFGTGADPVLGNFQILGVKAPFNCILERIELVGYANSLLVDLEVRWYKFPFTDGNDSLGAGTQVGATLNIGPNAPNMNDYSQDPAAVLGAGDFLVPFFRDTASAGLLNAQLMGQLVFRQIVV